MTTFQLLNSTVKPIHSSSYTFSTTPTSTTEHVINMDTPTSQAIAVADIDEDGVADVLALNDENLPNVTYVHPPLPELGQHLK